MIEMPRARRVEVCQAALAALLLPMISQDPYTAYCNALHKKIVADHGENFASKSDVLKALEFLVEDGYATAVSENPSHHGARVFYHPTSRAGFVLGLRFPVEQWVELDLRLDRKPAKKAA